MANARRCGGNSAWSNPGGASLLCYPGDISAAEREAWRAKKASG